MGHGEVVGFFAYTAFAALASGFVFLTVGLFRRPRATVIGGIGLVSVTVLGLLVDVPLIHRYVEPFLGVALVPVWYLVGALVLSDDTSEWFRHPSYVRFSKVVSIGGVITTGVLFGSGAITGFLWIPLENIGALPAQVSLWIWGLPAVFGLYGVYHTVPRLGGSSSTDVDEYTAG